MQGILKTPRLAVEASFPGCLDVEAYEVHFGLLSIGSSQSTQANGVFRRGPRWAKKVMRISFAALRFIVATGIESFVAMSALVAALFCVCNNIIFPIVAFHYCKVKKVGPCRKVLHGLVLVYGLFIMIFGTIAAAQSLSPSADGAPGEKLRPGLSAECLAEVNKMNLTAR
ncbi:BMY1 [Symbiodinium sp. CCMP2592]|nr:BMY1 [Symbiodinium sp. CCMP2592]